MAGIKSEVLHRNENGVSYRRAHLWQIILLACNAFNGMAVYSLVGYASYSASVGYGIATLAVGGILTFTRIFDAVTDPLLAFLYDRVNTRFGKIRPLLFLGWIIQSVGLLAMFHFMSSKGFGAGVFIACYLVYVIGYTIVNMTVQTIGPLMTNDPKQRPVVGVWSTAFNYLVPMMLTVLLTMVILPRFDNQYTQGFLTMAAFVCVGMSLIGVVLVSICVSAFDKPENFKGLGKKADERLKLKDMWAVLSKNRPLQQYIVSAASDKIAQQTASQSVVTTLLFGILIGNIQLGTMLSVISMLPSIVFAVIGAKYAGKHGNKEAIMTWTKYSIIAYALTILFFIVIDPKSIAEKTFMMIIFVLITLAGNGCMMCVTTANSAFMGDIIDYELDRSGKYIPAVVTGTYSLIDKIVSAFSATIATLGVALVGYHDTMPQPGDPSTTGIFWVTMCLKYGLAILGWICTLLALRRCFLTKSEMVEVQKRIEVKKAEMSEE